VIGGLKGKIDILMHLSVFRLLFLVALVTLIPACNRSDQHIKVYRLVKAPVESASTEQAAPASSTAATSQVRWELPEGWGPGAQSSMRYASFAATSDNGETVDISIVTFPGDGGSDLDNVNRWRQQIELAPVDSGQVSSIIAPLQSGNVSFSTADMTGTNSRTLAAWLRRDGHSWFFKMTGPSDAVEREKPNFVRFLQSIRF
jgi:hypothetical protein